MRVADGWAVVEDCFSSGGRPAVLVWLDKETVISYINYGVWKSLITFFRANSPKNGSNSALKNGDFHTPS